MARARDGICEDPPLPLAHVGDKKVKRFHFSEIIGGLPYMRATVTVYSGRRWRLPLCSQNLVERMVMRNHCERKGVAGCEGLPGVYSTIWCLCYKTNKLKKRREKEGNRPSQIAGKRGSQWIRGRRDARLVAVALPQASPEAPAGVSP
jgi:hypothetical protein